MKVFIQSIVAQILLNPYIFWRGYQAIPPKKSWRIPYILFFILELSIFFFGFTFRNVLPDSVMIAIQYICNTWYIASIYITLSLLGLEVLRLSNRFFHWFPGWITSHWKQTKLVLFFFSHGNRYRPDVSCLPCRRLSGCQRCICHPTQRK